MKLVMIGGGGFRTPLVYRALLESGDRSADALVTEIVLVDNDPTRLPIIRAVLDQLAANPPGDAATQTRAAHTRAGNTPGPSATEPSPVDGPVAKRRAPTVTTTTDLDRALDGADFVFTAVRVGGLEGRVADERVAADFGLLGQETTGPGGIAFGLRTVPVMVDIAHRIAQRAPDAWTINFTNPAGMITEAMQTVLGDRVIGICDSPLGLNIRARRALGLAPTTSGDYAGLNHLGWLRTVDDGGVDRLPELLSNSTALASFEEGQIFGADWLATLGALPNEYLYYYYYTREAIAATTAQTRAEFLLDQQRDFFKRAGADLDCALREWNRSRDERNASYMAAARQGAQRDDDDIDHGGYERVAVAVMRALAGKPHAGGEPTRLILNVANRGALVGMPHDAVVEVECEIDTSGARPIRVGSVLPGDEGGLVQQIKAVEQTTIGAALAGDPDLALRALGIHPLVDSVDVARELLAAYRARIPALDAVFH